jgi:hypothetical protein
MSKKRFEHTMLSPSLFESCVFSLRQKCRHVAITLYRLTAMTAFGR